MCHGCQRPTSIALSLFFLLAAGACSGSDSSNSRDVAALEPGVTWFWQLHGKVDEGKQVQVYDIDLEGATPDLIARLKAKGRTVICYFSAGTFEDFRPDAASVPASAIGKTLEDWPDERWFDVRHPAVRELVTKRLDVAADRNCDGVEPDNVDAYQNDSGFPLSANDQIAFNRFIADQAHARGLSVGLKNAAALVPDLVDDFDWSLVEQCFEYDECESYTPFVKQGKAVLVAEYTELSQAHCETAAKLGLSLAFFTFDLDGAITPCPSGP